MTEYELHSDEQEGTLYVDLTPYRTKYEGIAVRQTAVDLPFGTMIIDYDSLGRVLGIEFVLGRDPS